MRDGAEQLAQLERVDAELLDRLSRPGPRYTSYPTAPEWTADVDATKLTQNLELADEEGPRSPLSLYLHIPFCEHMCTYCGCNVVVARRRERADRYIDFLGREIDLVSAHIPARRRVSQLHLGGGTPTFLDERQLRNLWSQITDRFQIEPDAEVALEIDPVVTSTEQLTLLAGLGFNRVSMGVQDFTTEVQQYIGRVQSLELTERLYSRARELGYTGINFDLIYGLPKQRPETFERTIEQVVRLRPDRVAVFSYAHVPWMRPHQRAFDEALIPKAADKFRLFTIALRGFLQAGYIQIGMDHFALPEDELAQARLARRLHRNFQGYTVKPASDLLAFGITGISDVRGCYTQNVKPLGRYYRILERGEIPVERGWELSAEDRLRRRVITQIMCNFYVDLSSAGRAFGVDPRRTFARELSDLQELEQLGLVTRDDLVLELTALGRILVRNVAMVFDSFLRARTDDARPAAQTFSKTI